MKILCLGDGVAGLGFALSMKLRDPGHAVTVVASLDLGQMLVEDAGFAGRGDVAVLHRGVRMLSQGEAMGPDLRMLAIAHGVEMVDISPDAAGFDLVVQLVPSRQGRLRLLTDARFDAAQSFIIEKTAQGWVWAEVVQGAPARLTLGCAAATFDAWGFAAMAPEEVIETCRLIFADHLAEAELWLAPLGDLPAVQAGSGHHVEITADGAMLLADALLADADLGRALVQYRAMAAPLLARQAWFDQLDRLADLDAPQFAYALLTSGLGIGHAALRARDPVWLGGLEAEFAAQAGAEPGRAPMFAPLQLRGLRLENRIVVAPMAQYRAVDGAPNDWHFIHYAERAKGGAGLVMTEMTCVTANGRATPGCTGLYTPKAEAGWKRINDFIHAETQARTCCQIGHAGPRGSTQVGWAEADAPLVNGNWPLLSASAIAYQPGNQLPKAMDRDDMDKVLRYFIKAVEMAEAAEFDMIELQAGHGYLLASFLSPLRNLRDDDYGGSLENRMRFPLEVFREMRAYWPGHKPMSVRIPAQAGMSPSEVIEIASLFAAEGADVLDISGDLTGLSAAVRSDLGLVTMTGGDVTTSDRVNQILLTGSADLVCLGRAHLSDPYWTLNQAEALGDRAALWPKPYGAARKLPGGAGW